MSTPQHGSGSTAIVRKRLRGFDHVAPRIARHLRPRYGDARADQMIAETRREYERIIPELPFIGGTRNAFSPVIIANGWIIALFRTMKAHGKTAENTVEVCAAVADEWFRSLPRWALRLGRRIAFSAPVRAYFKKQAARSQERRYPEDFVYTFRAGGEEDLAFEFTECAVNKLYKAQAVEELKPYCNFFDVTYSRLMGMGVDANRTIGLGCETCQLRYKPGRETVIPERLKGLLPRA